MFPTLSYDPEVDDKPQPSFDQWQFWVNANVNDEPDIYFMQKEQDVNFDSFNSFWKRNDKLMRHERKLNKSYKKLRKHLGDSEEQEGHPS